MNVLSIALVALLALGLGACSSPCEELAERLCACEGGERTQRDCVEDRLQEAESAGELDDAEQASCERFVDSCDCRALDTVEGKRACGIAP